jgi:hypothetical protein
MRFFGVARVPTNAGSDVLEYVVGSVPYMWTPKGQRFRNPFKR